MSSQSKMAAAPPSLDRQLRAAKAATGLAQQDALALTAPLLDAAGAHTPTYGEASETQLNRFAASIESALEQGRMPSAADLVAMISAFHQMPAREQTELTGHLPEQLAPVFKLGVKMPAEKLAGAARASVSGRRAWLLIPPPMAIVCSPGLLIAGGNVLLDMKKSEEVRAAASQRGPSIASTSVAEPPARDTLNAELVAILVVEIRTLSAGDQKQLLNLLPEPEHHEMAKHVLQVRQPAVCGGVGGCCKVSLGL